MDNFAAIDTYEQFLMGKRKLSLSGTDQEKEKQACAILRFAVEKLLGWTPKDAMECLTPEVLMCLRLNSVLKYIKTPRDVFPELDIGWYLAKAFPIEIKYDVSKSAIILYRQIMAGQRTRFPKCFFAGPRGQKKAEAILWHVIKDRLAITEDSTPLYELFADNAKIKVYLKKWKLASVCKSYFESPVEYLHGALPNSMKDTFLLNAYQFRKVYQFMT